MMNDIKYKNIAIIYSAVPADESRHEDDSAFSTVQAFKKALEPVQCKVYCIPYPCKKNDVIELTKFLIDNAIDFVVNFCEEINGESFFEGNFAAFLELLKIDFSGSNSHVLNLCLNKFYVSSILKEKGINVPANKEIQDKDDIKDISYPLIIKPVSEDGSFGLSRKSVCYNINEAISLYEELKDKINGFLLMEEYIQGREINVSILEGIALACSEVEFTYNDKNHPDILTYQAKWNIESDEYENSKIRCPATLDLALEATIKGIAEHVFKILNLKDYARVDFRIDQNGTPFVIDVNPNPCIAPDSGFVNALKVNGEYYKKIIAVFNLI